MSLSLPQRLYRTESIITRSTNVTAYQPNQVIRGNGLTGATSHAIHPIDNLESVIVNAELYTNNANWTAGIKVHLYSTNPNLTISDYGAFQNRFADRTNKIGVLYFSSWSTGGAGSDCAESQIQFLELDLILQNTRNIFYHLECLDAATPIASQQFSLFLTVRP